ncbi:unnamed protein product [Miscanthus lutarioriparius]|uniref:Uncharacterized protein n=1 Tax=Miscanthus lutarioriparius TaxID=422564 RepID=A0A811SC04_9POAL|nr:unnamed protein product [Miscanthus lutarioriparius]
MGEYPYGRGGGPRRRRRGRRRRGGWRGRGTGRTWRPGRTAAGSPIWEAETKSPAPKLALAAAVSGASAMARVSRHKETGRRDSGEGGTEGRTGGDSGAAWVWVARALQRTERERERGKKERRKGKETSQSDRSLGKKTVNDRRSGIGGLYGCERTQELPLCQKQYAVPWL